MNIKCCKHNKLTRILNLYFIVLNTCLITYLFTSVYLTNSSMSNFFSEEKLFVTWDQHGDINNSTMCMGVKECTNEFVKYCDNSNVSYMGFLNDECNHEYTNAYFFIIVIPALFLIMLSITAAVYDIVTRKNDQIYHM